MVFGKMSFALGVPMTKKLVYLSTILLLCATGCVYESFEEPTFVGPANVVTPDGGGADADTDIPDMTVLEDMGPGDAGSDTGTDAGTDAADMAMEELPWQCNPTEAGTGGMSSGKLQVEAIQDGWLMGWINQQSQLELRSFDLDGAVTGGTTLTPVLATSSSAFELLAPPGDRPEGRIFVGYATAGGGIGLQECQAAQCESVGLSNGSTFDSVTTVSGFWYGENHYPYLGFFDTASPPTLSVWGLAPADGAPKQLTNVMFTEDIGPRTIDVSYNSIATDPTLTSPTSSSFSTTTSIWYVDRPNSGAMLERPAIDCGVTPGNVGKVYVVPNTAEALVVADRQIQADVRLSRIDCQTGGTVALTATLEQLHDWDATLSGGQTRTFYAAADRLASTVYSGNSLPENLMAEGSFRRVAADQSGNRYGVGTIDANGNVEFRTMSSTGECF